MNIPTLNGVALGPMRQLATDMVLGADRWNFILPTERGLATRRAELLPGAVTVVVNGALVWCKTNRADVWATDTVASKVNKFPPGLNVWGPPSSEVAFRAKSIPFVPLQPNAVMGPGQVPREADAFFKAMDLACTSLGAKRIRVFGALDWRRPDVRWKRWALAHCIRKAGAHGIEIERVR